ncbi:MAG TPA: response regulator [Roseiflexaceae bacterium]|nr:response regulator [Roseiflexaceae bacterium]
MSFATQTVLLVEDNQNDVLLLQRAMRRAQWTNPVQVVEHGDAAIAYLAGDAPYDNRARYPLPGLVLLDLKLPRRSGLEVLAWLRAQPALRCLPVVVLTSSKEHRDVSQAYQLGVNSYLVKPGAPQDLQALITLVSSYWNANELPPILPGPPSSAGT